MDEAPLNNPHDSFIKAGLGDPRQMASFLQAYLPAALTAAVDWSSLQSESTEFLDEQLHHRHVDLLFSASFHSHPIFLHLLFEHQKSLDPWMPLRLLGYQVRVWEHYRKTNPKAKRLPPILPIVFFQDRGEWTISPHFHDLLELPRTLDPQWLEFIPDFKHVTINLSNLSLEPIEQNLTLRVMMKVLRAILDPDPANSFTTGLHALQDLIQAPDQQTFLRTCLTYLARAGNTLDRKTLFNIITEVSSTNLKDAAMTIAEQLIKEGRKEGRQEGERLLLERQLIRKFGSITAPTREKLNQADKNKLERWGERILDAKSLAEVFD